MPAPSRHREIYLRGEIQTYMVPTVKAVDVCLASLRRRLETTGTPAHPKIWRDVDLLLDRRRELSA